MASYCARLLQYCPRCNSYQIMGYFILTFLVAYTEMSFFLFLFPAWQKYLTGFSILYEASKMEQCRQLIDV